MFAFEADFVASLRCIPMGVRLKLDTCGVKLKLNHWHCFTMDERQRLVEQSCDTTAAIAAYRDGLQALVVAHTGEPAKTLPTEAAPAWLNATEIPAQVQDQEALHQEERGRHSLRPPPRQHFARREVQHRAE
ncbi:MAG: nitrate reductase associated protein, partial [Spirulinaceae cyanobacterium]